MHKNTGAKMGEFAGYDMPLYYPEGVIKEHEWVRSQAGLFDVSHMGQGSIKGDGACAFVQKLTPSSFEKLPENRAKYTVLLNEQGGIIDDLIITKTSSNEFHFVINAGCKDKDLAWIKSCLPDGMELTHYEDWALLALQGPRAEEALQDVLGVDLSGVPYMGLWYQDYTMFISRLGYTGEDGFEISVPDKDAPALWESLMAHQAVKPIGLAARDSLRLEMGYPLYGHDITEETSPVEADLSWVIGKDSNGYFGYKRIRRELAEGASRKRVGLKLLGKGIAREGVEIRSVLDKKIGVLTSGGFSPTLKQSVGQGYIEAPVPKLGEKVFVNVRGRNIEAEIASMPFVKSGIKSKKKG